MKPTRISEKRAQAKLMEYALDQKNHILAAPNITIIYNWECDLLSVTRAHYTHEFEIKRTRSDYQAEFKNKISKHQLLKRGYTNGPNYFWFVTADLDIHPPEYAGWIQLTDTGNSIDLWIRKEAPLLHRQKLTQKKIDAVGRICAYRLKDCLLFVTADIDRTNYDQ